MRDWKQAFKQNGDRQDERMSQPTEKPGAMQLHL
jgi:hypothetical protein